MFENASATAVLPAADLDRARGWWHDVLGRDPLYVEEEAGMAFYEIGGVMVMVYVTQFAGTAQNTAFNVFSEDFDGDLAALRSAGVTFFDYDLPGFATVDGVADLGGQRVAWFADSEGNIFAIGEMTGGMAEMAQQLRATASGAS